MKNSVPVTFVPNDSDLRNKLSEYGSMDNIAYVLLIPVDEITLLTSQYHDEAYYEPKNHLIESLLTRSYSNKWTIGEINGVVYGIGYAYRS